MLFGMTSGPDVASTAHSGGDAKSGENEAHQHDVDEHDAHEGQQVVHGQFLSHDGGFVPGARQVLRNEESQASPRRELVQGGPG